MPRSAGTVQPVPGASSRAAQLLQTLRERGSHRLQADSIHALSDNSARMLAHALALPEEDVSVAELRQSLAEMCGKAVEYYEDGPASPYTDLHAPALGDLLQLTDPEVRALEKAMRVGRISIGVDRISAAQSMAIAFGGMQSFRELADVVASAAGIKTSAVHAAAITAADVLASALTRTPAAARIELVTGFSMGGGSAQVFSAALAQRMPGQRPAMVLFDPQLLTQRELAKAAGARPEGVRGIAFTLNYDRHPSRPLMRRMAAAGYDASGLVQVELPLAPRAVESRVSGGEAAEAFGIEEPVPGVYGYHDQAFSWFGPCIRRFVDDPPGTQRTVSVPPGSPDEDAAR